MLGQGFGNSCTSRERERERWFEHVLLMLCTEVIFAARAEGGAICAFMRFFLALLPSLRDGGKGFAVVVCMYAGDVLFLSLDVLWSE